MGRLPFPFQRRRLSANRRDDAAVGREALLGVVWVVVKEEDAAVGREAVLGPKKKPAAIVEVAPGDRVAAVVGSCAVAVDGTAAATGMVAVATGG